MRQFEVAGAMMQQDDSILLVCNRRKNGRTDWSPPGGIVDDGESVIEGLTREVAEETQLDVTRWGPLLYEVNVEFLHLDWQLTARVFAAEEWSGQLHVDDPDGVVIDAEFIDLTACEARLGDSPRWVKEPLLAWTQSQPAEPRNYRYRAERSDSGLHVERLDI